MGPDKLEIREYPVPDIPPDGGLVKVEMGGVCGTDVKYLHGKLRVPYPIILGHEILGRVEKLGKNAAAIHHVKEGDRIILKGAIDPNSATKDEEERGKASSIRERLLEPAVIAILHQAARAQDDQISRVERGTERGQALGGGELQSGGEDEAVRREVRLRGDHVDLVAEPARRGVGGDQ